MVVCIINVTQFSGEKSDIHCKSMFLGNYNKHGFVFGINGANLVYISFTRIKYNVM